MKQEQKTQQSHYFINAVKFSSVHICKDRWDKMYKNSALELLHKRLLESFPTTKKQKAEIVGDTL